MNRISKVAAVVAFLIAGVLSADARTLKVFCWNVRSFEDGDPAFSVTAHVNKIKALNPDIVCFNEFETATDRMLVEEKMAEVASILSMYGFYVMSYPKDSGYYGNVILSKYPIISSASTLLTYKHYKGEGNYQFNSGSELENYGADQRSVGYADILVPAEQGTTIVRVVCSHFDHQGLEAVRTRQAQEAVDFASLASPVYPTIMMGDLNAASESTLKPLFDNGDHVGVSWVDHIFTFPKGAATYSNFQSVPASGLSDHNAIYAEINFK